MGPGALRDRRHGRGPRPWAAAGRGPPRCWDLPGVAALLEATRELVQQLTDPGVLSVFVGQVQRALDGTPRRRVEVVAPLTDRELTVLRLLPTQLSTREIGRELSVSVNTVRSQVQAIYRKLGVSSRAEAVTQARELGLLPKA